jgi:hypothetical protein
MKKLFDLFFPNRPSPEKRLEALATTYHHARISAELDLIDAECFLAAVKAKAAVIAEATTNPAGFYLASENRPSIPSRSHKPSPRGKNALGAFPPIG